MSLMSTSEAASALGVQEVRVRRMLSSGQLAGCKVGKVWIVDRAAVEAAADARRLAGRPMSAVMARAMIDLIGQHLGASPGAAWSAVEHRGRTRLSDHLRRLLLADDPAPLLRSWLPHRSERRVYAFRGEMAELLGDARVVPGGSHHAELPLSGGPADLHVAQSDIDDLVWEHLLVADPAGDVIVHVEPSVRTDLAACLVDIAQSGGPRNDAVVAEVLAR
ncbi:MAG: helix-turn-helix domain-containing protein [Propioniciclava sp.]|uniref:helix-turn-helix domain-containing protein n=1 Tax=Propioniciclava sp. TaxID=2038686 RepID=UPI0039E33B2B